MLTFNPQVSLQSYQLPREHIHVRVTNASETVVPVPNSASLAPGGVAYLELEFTDAQGHDSPPANMVVDSFVPMEQSDEHSATRLLR